MGATTGAWRCTQMISVHSPPRASQWIHPRKSSKLDHQTGPRGAKSMGPLGFEPRTYGL